MCGKPLWERYWRLSGFVALAAVGAIGSLQAEEARFSARPIVFVEGAATAQESFTRGWANVLRANSEAAVNHAQAANLVQQARERAIAVDMQRIQARWAIREQGKRQRFGERVDAEAIARLNAARKPRPLPGGAVAPGSIRWPQVLRGEEFESERQFMLEASVGMATSNRIRNSRDRMLAMHKRQIHTIGNMEYVVAKRFIESLAFEFMQAQRPHVAAVALHR